MGARRSHTGHDEFLEGMSLLEFHDQKGDPLFFSNGVYRGDVGVGEVLGDLGFPLQSGGQMESFFMIPQCHGNGFDRHRAFVGGIETLIDNARGPMSQDTVDAVVADFFWVCHGFSLFLTKPEEYLIAIWNGEEGFGTHSAFHGFWFIL